MSSARAAERYIARGLTVVPVPAGKKRPVLEGWEKLRITAEEIPEYWSNGQNIGIHTGEPSKGLVVVDHDCPEALKIAGRFLAPTLTSGRESTPDAHWWYFSPDTEHQTFKDLDGTTMLLELRSTGHHTLAPPSIHPCGERYRWSQSGLETAESAPGDLTRTCRELATTTLIARHLPETRDQGGGGRHDLALALAGFLLRRGLPEDTVLGILLAAWDTKGFPEERERREAHRDLEGLVPDTAAKLRDDEPATGGTRLEELVPGVPRKVADYWGWKGSLRDEGSKTYMRTDLGNAERLAARHGNDLRYCFKWQCWLAYDGTRWKPDDGGEIRRRAKDTVRRIYAEAGQATDDAERKAIAKHAIASEAESRVSAMIRSARSELEVAHTELDTDPYLLNVENGTLDLRTGELREHRRQDLITKVAGTYYDPEARAPQWEAHLARVQPDAEQRSYLHRALGYSLTADVSEDALFVPYGTGDNGKTVTYNTMLHVAGDYGTSAAPDLLLTKKDTHPTEIADLFGARLVVCMEAEEGRRMAESLVKRLTGGDPIKARRMNENFWTFLPTHKIHLSVNHKPAINGTDNGIWRRVKIIPFTVKISEEEKDRYLEDKLQSEAPGILAWAVRGSVDWYRNGMREPHSVQAATSEYKTQMDVLAAFLSDRCFIGLDATAPATTLFKQFELWCEESGEKKGTQRAFGMKLTERGFDSDRYTSGVNKGKRFWRGIGIQGTDGGPPNPPSGPNGGEGPSNHSPPESPIGKANAAKPPEGGE